jgi:hypothetical protein
MPADQVYGAVMTDQENKTTDQAAEPPSGAKKKKPYTKPVLTEYGKLNLLTQGTGSFAADAGSGMMR